MFDEIKEVIVDTLSCDADSVTESASFMEDLGADSLDVVELSLALEEKLGVKIEDSDLENIKTVGDVVKYIEEHK